MKELQLAELASSINSKHDEYVQCYRQSLEHARGAGELLIQVKEKVGHGKLDEWMISNLRFSKRSAQAYMQVARNWDELLVEAKAQELADLGLQQALRLLAKPKPSERIPESNERQIALPPEKPKLLTLGDDLSVMHPRPYEGTTEAKPGTDWFYATEEQGDPSKIVAVAPQVEQDSMTDQQVSAFHESLLNAIRRLETLEVDASRIPKQHSLLNDISELLNHGLFAINDLKEAITNE